MTKTYSIIRTCEYEKLTDTPTVGSVLDIGGSTKSGYHDLLKGATKITTVNIDPSYGCDLVFDIQKPFPLESNSFDTVVSMNVLEHIFDFHPVFSEVYRVIKPGGQFISSTPFMFHIHGSPDDYFRYTESALKSLAERYGFQVEKIEPLGYGLLSLFWQIVGGAVPTRFLRGSLQKVVIAIDKILLYIPAFKKLNKRIPLGYFWVFKKPEA